MNTDRLLALGWTQLWQVSLAITVIGPIACFVFRRRPHWAYALWLLLLVKTVTPPLWSSPTGVFSWLAIERVEPPAAAADAAPALPQAGAAPLSPPVVAAPAPAMSDFTAQAELPPVETRPAGRVIPMPAISVSAIVLAVWGAGALGVVLIVAAVSVAMLRRLRRDAREPSPELARLFGELRSTIGAGRRVRLVISGERFGPALVGLVRPQVVLPSAVVEEKPTGELAPILAHELVHLRRGDNWIAHVQLVAQALWWFHPLVWWMNRQLGRAREMGCDEEVLATLGCEPADYAQALLDVVRLRRVEQEFRTMPLALSMQSAEFAAVRLTHIMSGSLRFQRRTPAACWAAIAVAALAILPGGGRLNGADKAEDPVGETIVRTVVDGESGKPLAGVPVTVEHVILPAAGQKVIATTKYVSDKEGKYEIKIPASELEHPTLSLRFAIDEPGYAPPAATQYGVQYFRQARRRGLPIPFDVDRIYPGAEVTGTIVDPQGKPVADLPVHVLSTLALNPNQAEEAARLAKLAAENDESGATATFSANPPVTSHTVVRTDAQGRFRFNALKQGSAVFWVEPAGYAVLSRSIGQQRGDIGKTVLEPGVRVAGRVVDADGQPVPGVWVHLVAAGPRQPFGTDNDPTSRAAETDAQGRFRTEPVHPGQFVATVGATAAQDNFVEGNLPAVFERAKIAVAADQPETAVEIRAVPHYTIRAHFTDAAGKPFGGAKLVINAQRKGKPYVKVFESDSQGLAVARVPRDLDAVRVGTMQGEPDSVYRRRSNDGLLWNDAEINLGHLDHDVDNLNFIHYRPPTLWITLVDAAGKPIKGWEVDPAGKPITGAAQAKVDYLLPDGQFSPERTQTIIYPLGGGRWTTLGLLPDQPVVITIDAQDHQPVAYKIKLAEGESEELKVVFKPEAQKP